MAPADSAGVAPTARTGFLAPYRVLDLTDERGLLAGHLLAQLGAEVIQVERPDGSPARRVGPFAPDADGVERSLFWAAYAAGKRGVSLAYDRPEGRDLLLGLAREADLLIESERPGVMGGWGLDDPALRAANPRLIHVSITAFGSEGPKAAYEASDLVVWAAGGPLWPHRTPDGLPLRISVPQAFHQAALDAAGGALVALLARGAEGPGQHVDVSAQQSVTVSAMASHLAEAVNHPDFNLLGGVQSPRLLDLSGSGIRTRKTKWRVRDGLVEMHMGMGPAAGRFTNALFAWLARIGELPDEFADWDWMEVPARIEAGSMTADQLNRARAHVGEVLARYTKAELMQIAQDEGLLLAPVMTTADLLASPQLAARGYFAAMGEDRLPLPSPFRTGCGTGAAAAMCPAPALGEHTAAVFGELLGLSVAEVADLARRGIV